MKRLLILLGVLVTACGLGLLISKTTLVSATSQALACECSWTEWVDTSKCVAVECGTDEGVKSQERTCEVEVCDIQCPSVKFSTSRTLYEKDFIEYGVWGEWSTCTITNFCSIQDRIAGKCEDNKCGNSPNRYERRYRTVTPHVCPTGYTYDEQEGQDDCYKVETFGPIDVQYGKSQDPNHCHKPTPESLDLPTWTIGDYGKLVTELDPTPVDCKMEVVDTETKDSVACVAEVVACDEEPDLCDDETALNYQEEGACEYEQDEPEDEPEEEEPKDEPKVEVQSSSPSMPSAPSCRETAPVKEAANPHLYRNGDVAIVKWYPSEGSQAHIYWKEHGASEWQHSLRDVANTGYYEIGGLGVGDWDFAVQQANGCAAGPISPVIEDGNALGVLFTPTLGLYVR